MACLDLLLSQIARLLGEKALDFRGFLVLRGSHEDRVCSMVRTEREGTEPGIC